MLKRLCTAKVANLIVTKAELHYEGSLGLDRAIPRASGIRAYEMVLIANVANGRRFETYAIPEPEGSGACSLYGGAAHMGAKGDELIVMAYGYFQPPEIEFFQGPVVVRLRPDNRVP